MTIQKIKPAPRNQARLMSIERPAVPALIDRDDLLQIDGIDPAMEMALNSLGIRRFADFKDYTPQSLSQALQDRTGLSVSGDLIARQDWLAWAEILTAEVIPAECEATKDEAMENLIVLDDKNNLVESVETLTPIAMDMAPAAEVEEALTQHSEQAGNQTAINEMAIRISEVRFTPITLQEATETASVKRLWGEINCELAGTTVAGMLLCAQIHAVNTATDEWALVAVKTERLPTTQTEYRFQLEFAAPLVGHYRLQIVAFLLQADPVIAFWQGPFLRVLP